MYFRLEQTIREFQLDEVVLNYEVQKSQTHTLRIYQPTKSDQQLGHKPENAHCEVLCEWNTSAKIEEIFRAIGENKILQAGQESDHSYRGPTGEKIQLPPYLTFPPHFRQFLETVHADMADAVRQVVGAIRWRCGMLGPVNAVSERDFSWSVDLAFWHSAPRKFNVSIDVHDCRIRINAS